MVISIIISLGTSFLLVTILNILLNKNSNGRIENIKWQHYFFGYLFILYLIIALKEVVGFPALSDWKRTLEGGKSIFEPVINLLPLSDGLEISAILNIIFFMPFGFLLPTLWKKYRVVYPTVITALVFSLIIEIGQLFTSRATDITDLIMNTLGAVFGWIIFKGISKIFYKLSNKTVVAVSSNDSMIIKLEVYLYIVIGVISTVLS